MRSVILFIIGWYVCACTFTSFAQEIKTDTLHSVTPEKNRPLLPDTLMFKSDLRTNPIRFPETDALLFRDSALFSFEKQDLNGIGYHGEKVSKPILPWEITSGLNFNVVPSRWDVPLLGPTTTFAPTLSYQLSDKILLYGGVGFTQYPNLGFVQHALTGQWSSGSNITTQAFGGIAYDLHDRIKLHGTFQHSLYNPMPSNLRMFAPPYNTMSIGADIDVWKGLGVTIDRVLELDRTGRMRQYTRYSPYIDIGKFMKFLGY
jgi:hypothetical protein